MFGELSDFSTFLGRIRPAGVRIACRSLGSARQDTQAPHIRETSPIRAETSQAEFFLPNIPTANPKLTVSQSGRIRSEDVRVGSWPVRSLRQDTQAQQIREISPIRPETSQVGSSPGEDVASFGGRRLISSLGPDSVRRRSNHLSLSWEPSTRHPGPTDPRDQPHPTRNQPGRMFFRKSPLSLQGQLRGEPREVQSRKRATCYQQHAVFPPSRFLRKGENASRMRKHVAHLKRKT